MKVAAYLRVSTDVQAERGHGLDVQEAAVRTWAKAHKHQVVSVCRDEGASGSNGLDTREGLADAFACIKAGEAAGLIVYRLDRLARDLIVQETLLAELRRMDAEVFSTSAAEAGYLGDDPDDPSRKLIRQVLGAVSEYERSMIALRMRSGRRRKAEAGGYSYGGPPFGKRAVGGALVPDETEQAALTLIRQMAAAGASTRATAAALNEAGHKPRRAGEWTFPSVAKILRRERADNA